MSITNVKTEWVGGDLYFYDKAGNEIFHIDGTNRLFSIPSGSKFGAAGTQASAMTAQLTTITPADAAGTPDYAIAAVTNSSPFGFSNAAEAITLLYVIKNLQVRVLELENIVEGLGFAAAN